MSTAAKPRPILDEEVDLASKHAITDDPEFGLLLACCAERSASHADQVLDFVPETINWERWLSLVDHHRVVPQAYGALAGIRESLPDKIFRALQSRYRDNACKALWFTGELVRIVSHLESVGIETLPYKGPVLSRALYGEVTQRQFSDLDILVRPADVLRARTALLELGYKCGIDLGPRQQQAYIRNGYEYSFHGTHGSHLLELQWQILPHFYSVDFNMESLFERADKLPVGGHIVRTMAAADLLLVLCAHAAKHLWTQLSWLCDIAQLVASRDLDWGAIHEHAQRLGMQRILFVNLLLAQQLLGAALPQSIRGELLRDQTTRLLADGIHPIIESSQAYDTESIPYFRLMMRLRERRRDQARFIARLAFTPGLSEWSTFQLPESLSPLYRIVRLSRLARRLASSN